MNMKNINKLLGSILLISTLLIPLSVWSDERSDGFLTVIEMTVPYINSFQIVYGDESKFYVSRDVEVFIQDEGGKRSSIKELAAVGRIERARLYLKGATVVKIVVLKMAQ
jgi:hypothetical protein